MLAAAALFFWQDTAERSQRALREADQITAEVAKVCADLRLDPMDAPGHPAKIEADPNEYGVDPGPTFIVNESTSYKLTFLQANGFLTKYANNQLFNRLYESHSPAFEKPSAPKWTKDQAIQVGNAFVNALAPQIKIQLGEGSARFDQRQSNGTYQVGYWMIDWPRIDSKGHPFSDDGIIMEIPEGYGPLFVHIKQETLFNEERSESMQMSEALKRARSKITNDQSWDKLKSIFPGHISDGWTDPNPTNAYLEIVTPRIRKNAVARLAWVFWFKQHDFHAHYPVSLWIDAYTGRWIGGDVVGLDTPD